MQQTSSLLWSCILRLNKMIHLPVCLLFDKKLRKKCEICFDKLTTFQKVTVPNLHLNAKQGFQNLKRIDHKKDLSLSPFIKRPASGDQESTAPNSQTC
eukprot:c14582_g1_i2 orf=251-544(+)